MGEVLTRVYFESQGKRPYAVREARNLSRPSGPHRIRVDAGHENRAA